MPNLTTPDGGSAPVSEDAVAALGDALVGDLLRPESAEYDEARSLWNAMIDRRPDRGLPGRRGCERVREVRCGAWRAALHLRGWPQHRWECRGGRRLDDLVQGHEDR